MVEDAAKRIAQLAGAGPVEGDPGHHVAAAEPLRVLHRPTGDRAARPEIDELEGEADVLDKGRTPTLKQQFADLEAEGSVEAELEALRAKVKSGS